MRSQHTGMQPQRTGLQPQPTGLQPQVSGLQPQPTGPQPQPTGTPMQPQTTGVQPQRTGLQPLPTGPPLQSDRTGGSTFQLPSAMKAQRTSASLHPNPTGISMTPLRPTATGIRSPAPPVLSHAASVSERPPTASIPVPAPSQRSGSILLNPVPPPPMPAQYTGPVQPQPMDQRPPPHLERPPHGIPPMHAPGTGPRRPMSMYAGTPAPAPGFPMPPMPGAWVPSGPMPLGASKTGPIREPPPLQATRTGWAPGHARQRSRETMWTQPMEHHRSFSDNRFDNWQASHSAARAGNPGLGLGLGLGPMEPPGAHGNSLHLTGVPEQGRQRSVSIAPAHPDVIRRRSERGDRRLHADV